MANHVRYAVSVDVVDEYSFAGETAADSDGTPVPATSSRTMSRIYPEVGKTLGGGVSNNSDLSGWTSVDGYGDDEDGKPDYSEATDSAAVLSDTAGSMLFIKNPGYEYSTSTELGDASTDTLEVYAGSTQFCDIPAGGAIVLPNPTANDIKIKRGGSANLAVEYAFLD